MEWIKIYSRAYLQKNEQSFLKSNNDIVGTGIGPGSKKIKKTKQQTATNNNQQLQKSSEADQTKLFLVALSFFLLSSPPSSSSHLFFKTKEPKNAHLYLNQRTMTNKNDLIMDINLHARR